MGYEPLLERNCKQSDLMRGSYDPNQALYENYVKGRLAP